jgi:hypothetical protein
MKRQHIITFLLASFFIILSVQGAHVSAQNSLSGDEVCGKWDATFDNGPEKPKGKIVNPCGVSSAKVIFQGIFRTIIAIGLPLLVVFIIYRFVTAWYALQQGNANAYKEATKNATNAIFGFIIVVALFGGLFLAVLRYIGVNDTFLQLLKDVASLLVPHAYAADSPKMLPNPLGFTSIYDFILGGVNTVMKFFLYPAMIGIWVFSGFSYVAAQGAPEKLSKAHKLLLMAFITTLITFSVQGFLTAMKGSVNKILPAQTTTTNNTTNNGNGTPDGRTAPDDGETGSSCQMDDGTYGIMDVNKDCKPSSRGQANAFVDCSTMTSQSTCQSAKSRTTGNACVWSGGRDAICSE